MSGVSGPNGLSLPGASAVPSSVAQTIVDGEREIARETKDVVESGLGSSTQLALLSQKVIRQKQTLEAVSRTSAAYHKAAMNMIANLKA